MVANPKIEMAGMLNNEDWVRICGIVKVDPSVTAKEEFLKQSPVPGYSANDELFEILYFEKGVVDIYSFTRDPEHFEL